MKYALLICDDETRDISMDEIANSPAFQAFEHVLVEGGHRWAGARLRPVASATTVRVRDGETLVSDGPFAETKDVIGGIALIECDNLDDPIARAMVESLRLEQVWLTGTPLDDTGTAGTRLDEAHAAGDAAIASELALWHWRTDMLRTAPGWLVEPYASEIAGETGTAAAMWEAAGVPLETLRARSASDEETDLRHAHAGFIALGADPDATRVAHRMQLLGYRGVPRGPRPSTRQNPAHLSRREIEVLTLLAQGASNREIATRLSVSPKTVDHHVSAILGQLGAANRQQAVVRAREAGVLPK